MKERTVAGAQGSEYTKRELVGLSRESEFERTYEHEHTRRGATKVADLPNNKSHPSTSRRQHHLYKFRHVFFTIWTFAFHRGVICHDHIRLHDSLTDSVCMCHKGTTLHDATVKRTKVERHWRSRRRPLYIYYSQARSSVAHGL